MRTNPFGSNKASEILFEMLNTKYPFLLKKISSMFCRYSFDLNELKKLDSRTALNLSKLIHESYISVFNKYETPELKNFISNVFTARYRKFLKEIKSNAPYKNRKISA